MASQTASPEVFVSYDEDLNQIVIRMTDESNRWLHEVASRREKSLVKMVAEALRLERALADGDLRVWDKGKLSELVAI